MAGDEAACMPRVSDMSSEEADARADVVWRWGASFVQRLEYNANTGDMWIAAPPEQHKRIEDLTLQQLREWGDTSFVTARNACTYAQVYMCDGARRNTGGALLLTVDVYSARTPSDPSPPPS